MLLVDREIKAILSNGEIPGLDLTATTQTTVLNGSKDGITNIGYDLIAYNFYKNNLSEDQCELKPGDSVFVESFESVHFDNCTIGKLTLKNSRIRMGLTMDAPIYQPGHTTRIYFRLTNVSNEALQLVRGEKYAMLMFEQLDKKPDKPYIGAFSNEFSFNGLGSYKSKYADQIRELDQRIEDLRSLEKSIYGNILTILSVFVAVFTLLNINVSFTEHTVPEISFLIFNFTVLGGISFLALLLNMLINTGRKPLYGLWIIPVCCFVFSFVLALV